MNTSLIAALSLFICMLVAAEAGVRMGRIRAAKDPEGSQVGASVIGGAVLSLLGLILAFTFSAAASRLETRRQLIVQETNAIGTAYLRIDLLPANDQSAVRHLFRQYLDARLAVYDKIDDPSGFEAAWKYSAKLQTDIWSHAEAGTHGQTAAIPVLNAVNEMIDVTTARKVALRTHTPELIIYLMFGLAVLSAMTAGYGMTAAKKRNWPMTVIFSLAISMTVYVVLDLDNPNSGLIRLTPAEKVLVEMRETIK
jgi:hypothetical protein